MPVPADKIGSDLGKGGCRTREKEPATWPEIGELMLGIVPNMLPATSCA
jgi:hypothetical protein